MKCGWKYFQSWRGDLFLNILCDLCARSKCAKKILRILHPPSIANAVCLKNYYVLFLHYISKLFWGLVLTQNTLQQEKSQQLGPEGAQTDARQTVTERYQRWRHNVRSKEYVPTVSTNLMQTESESQAAAHIGKQTERQRISHSLLCPPLCTILILHSPPVQRLMCWLADRVALSPIFYRQ